MTVTPLTEKAEIEDSKFRFSLDNLAGPCLKIENRKGKGDWLSVQGLNLRNETKCKKEEKRIDQNGTWLGFYSILLCFETRLCYIAQAGLEFKIPLPQLPIYWTTDLSLILWCGFITTFLSP